jgi:hypothetical protein
MKIDYWGLIKFLIVVAIISSFIWAVFICETGWHKTTMRTADARNKAYAIKNDIYEARFPKTGDTIILNGKKIVILKSYIWSRERRYEVRQEDGTITDVMGSEIIDIKPIKQE